MQGQECQASLVNYRASILPVTYHVNYNPDSSTFTGRDGEAFLNLISVVPIRWKEKDTGEDKEYYVGFQVDVRTSISS